MRRERARKRKKVDTRSAVESDESSSNGEGRIKRNKAEMQREALQKHSQMCDAALKTMTKMELVLEKLQNKI